jgi:hypothetical protein
MKKLLLIPLLLLLFAFASDNKLVKQKPLCGSAVDYSNTNSFAENVLVKVKFVHSNGGQTTWNYPVLWGHDQYQNVQNTFLAAGTYSTITVVYSSDNATNNGFIYIADPDDNIIACQPAHSGGDSYVFNNVFINCIFGGAPYHIGVRDTPC